MLPTFGHQPVLAVLLALIPTAVAWWNGWRLRTKRDDPALPELLLERRQLGAKVFAAVVPIMIVFAGWDAAWGIPLLITLLIAADYPLRRGVLGETWGFGAYIWHTARSIFGGFGFWIALCLTPVVVQVLGRERWWAALLLIPVLLAWEWAYPKLWLRMHDARPLERADLAPRFDAIVQAAGGQPPNVYRIGAPGSRFVNALALPSVRRPAVAMGNALLELLEPDEIAAIFAHEVAHFDQYTSRAVRRLQLVNRALIVGGVGVTLAALFVAPGVAPWIGWLWPLAAVLTIGRRAATTQRLETESDLRAATLCGDPEALVRGLVKLHLHARVPRRWAVDLERMATHPSLVRRIQAIRAGTSGVSAPPSAAETPGPTVVRSVRPGSVVVLDSSRAYWLDGVPTDASLDLATLRDRASSYRALSYQDLIELRVVPVGDARVLRARGRQGETWSVPLAPADVERIQKALDVIDLQLGHGHPPSPSVAPKLIAAVVLSAAIMGGQTGIVLVPAALTLWRPSAASLAALGAVAIARAVLGALADNYWWNREITWVALAVLFVAGVAALHAAWRRMRTDESRQGFRETTVAMGGVAALIAASLVWQAAVGPPIAFIGGPLAGTLGVALLGAIAPLFTLERRAVRRAALGGVVLASLLATLSVDLGVFARRTSLPEVTARAVLVGEADLERAGQGLRLSPSGSRFVVMRLPANRYPIAGRGATISVGRFAVEGRSGAIRDIDGVGADFVDEEHVLVIAKLDAGIELRVEHADSGGAPSWADTLPELDEPRLQLDREAGAWGVVGDDLDADQLTLLVGRVGQKGSSRRVSLPDTLSTMGDPMVLGGGASVMLPVFAAPGSSASVVGMLPGALMGIDPLRGELWQIADGTVRRAAAMPGIPQCGESEGGAAACLTRHVRRMSLWVVDADGRATEVANLPVQDIGSHSVGPGLRVVAFGLRRDALIVDLDARRLTRVALPEGAGYPAEIRATATHMATVTYEQDRRGRVQLYRVEGASGRE